MTAAVPPAPSPGPGRVSRRVVLVVGLLVGLSAVWGAIDAVRVEPRVWGLLGFEVVTLAASVVGVAVGLGRPREAPGLACACVAATVFAAGTLGRFSAIVTRASGTVSEGQAVRQLLSDPMYDARLLAAGVVTVAAIVLALGGDRVAWRRLIVGSVLAVPVLAAGGWLVGPGTDWMVAPVESTDGVVRVLVVLAGGLMLAILAASSVQQVVGAFEPRRPSRSGPGSPRKPAGRAPNKSV